MIYIYDRNEKQINNIDLKPILTEEINKLKTLEFETEIELEKGWRVVYLDDNQAHEFIIVQIFYTRENKKQFNYFCLDSIIELKTEYIEDKRPNGNLNLAATSLLADTRWSHAIRYEYQDTQNISNSFYRTTVLEAFSNMIEKYNVEWHTEVTHSGSRITSRKIIFGKRGAKINSRLEFEKNIKKFERNINEDDIITAVYAFGKGQELTDEEGNPTGTYGRRIDFSSINNGKAYVEDLEALAVYGFGAAGNKRHKFHVEIFEDIEDPQMLLDEAKKILQAGSKITAEYKIDSADFEVDGHVGDSIAVIDEEINFADYVRIIKTVRQGNSTEYTLGVKAEKFSYTTARSISKLQEELTNVNQAVTAAKLSADGKNTIFTGEAEPTANKIGDTWFKPLANGEWTLLHFDGTNWVELINTTKISEARIKADEAVEQVDEAAAKADAAMAEVTRLNTEINNLGDLSAALAELDEAQTQINNLKQDMDGLLAQVNPDFYGNAPQPPYLLNQKWYKTAYTPSQEIDQGYDTINQEHIVTLDEFSNPGLFVCINPKPEGAAFDWNDWKRIASDSTSTIQAIADYQAQQLDILSGKSNDLEAKLNNQENKIEQDRLEIQTLANDLLNKADLEDFNTVSETVEGHSRSIGALTTDNEQNKANINTITNTATKTEQALIDLIGQDVNGNYLVAAYNSKISTATEDIQKIYADLDPNTEGSTGFKLSENIKTAAEIKNSLTSYAKTEDLNGLVNEELAQTIAETEAGKVRVLLSDYARTTDLDGLATETYVSNQVTSTQSAIQTELLNYAKKTDLDGLATETYARTIVNEEAGKINQTLLDYVKTADLDNKGFTTIENINNLVQTTTGTYQTFAELIDGEIKRLSKTNDTLDEYSRTLLSLEDEVKGIANIVGGTPQPPYEVGWVWLKDAYTFTQDYDIIEASDNMTLAEFSEAGSFICINPKPEGAAFDWNDWKRISGDSQGQISSLTQTLNEYSVSLQNLDNNTKAQFQILSDNINQTVRKDQLLTTINQQADNILLMVEGTTGKSVLNLTELGTYIEKGLIGSADIKEGAINTAHIGTLNFDWAIGKTIDAGKINVLNLNNTNFVGQTIRTSWLTVDEDFEMQGQAIRFTNNGNLSTIIDRERIHFYDQTNNARYSGSIGAARLAADTNVTLLNLGHRQGAYLSLDYYDTTTGKANPYLIFDKDNLNPDYKSEYWITATRTMRFIENTQFRKTSSWTSGTSSLGMIPYTDRVFIGNTNTLTGLMWFSTGTVTVMQDGQGIKSLHI